MIDAEVTVKFVISDICNEDDIDDTFSFDDAVKDVIESEGLYSLILYSDDYEITEIKPIH